MNYTDVSKEIAYALRHAPWKYELEMDEMGFVPVEQLLTAFNEEKKYDRTLTRSDLVYLIEHSDKRRYELSGTYIRALYGHSIPMYIRKEPGIPPSVLYHGTTHQALPLIRRGGLRPMGRQYVHLSIDTKTAQSVGGRRDRIPVILQIDTERAIADGSHFFIGNEMVWLADFISPSSLRVLK